MYHFGITRREFLKSTCATGLFTLIGSCAYNREIVNPESAENHGDLERERALAAKKLFDMYPENMYEIGIETLLSEPQIGLKSLLGIGILETPKNFLVAGNAALLGLVTHTLDEKTLKDPKSNPLMLYAEGLRLSQYHPQLNLNMGAVMLVSAEPNYRDFTDFLKTPTLSSEQRIGLESSILYFDRASHFFQGIFASCYNKGIALMYLGRLSEAERHLTEAIEGIHDDMKYRVKKPVFTDEGSVAFKVGSTPVFAMSALCRYYHDNRVGVTVKGIKLIEHRNLGGYIEGENDFLALAHFYRGVCRSQMGLGNNDGAEGDFQKAIAFNPYVSVFFTAFRKHLLMAGKEREADRMLERFNSLVTYFNKIMPPYMTPRIERRPK